MSPSSSPFDLPTDSRRTKDPLSFDASNRRTKDADADANDDAALADAAARAEAEAAALDDANDVDDVDDVGLSDPCAVAAPAAVSAAAPGGTHGGEAGSRRKILAVPIGEPIVLSEASADAVALDDRGRGGRAGATLDVAGRGGRAGALDIAGAVVAAGRGGSCGAATAAAGRDSVRAQKFDWMRPTVASSSSPRTSQKSSSLLPRRIVTIVPFAAVISPSDEASKS